MCPGRIAYPIPLDAIPEKPCPACKGAGQLPEMVNDGDENRTVQVPCHICHGIGKVPDKKAEGVQETLPGTQEDE